MSMTARNSTAIRVFIINGYRCILWGLERLIESAQLEMKVVGSATSCAEAFEEIDAAAPDLILLDLDLGHEDGVAAIVKLKARSRAKILVLTGSRDESLHDDAVLAGASGVVRKESPAQVILAAIDKVHKGQLWLDRITTGRIFGAISKIGASREFDPERAKIASLTEREKEIVTLAAGHADAKGRSLAQMLGISEHTLRNHLTAIYNKLNVSNRLALCAYAYKHGLTPTSPAPSEATDTVIIAARGADSSLTGITATAGSIPRFSGFGRS
jgi:two-component system nitrate/nitrite response regulator NarL